MANLRRQQYTVFLSELRSSDGRVFLDSRPESSATGYDASVVNRRAPRHSVALADPLKTTLLRAGREAALVSKDAPPPLQPAVFKPMLGVDRWGSQNILSTTAVHTETFVAFAGTGQGFKANAVQQLQDKVYKDDFDSNPEVHAKDVRGD